MESRLVEQSLDVMMNLVQPGFLSILEIQYIKRTSFFSYIFLAIIYFNILYVPRYFHILFRLILFKSFSKSFSCIIPTTAKILKRKKNYSEILSSFHNITQENDTTAWKNEIILHAEKKKLTILNKKNQRKLNQC